MSTSSGEDPLMSSEPRIRAQYQAVIIFKDLQKFAGNYFCHSSTGTVLHCLSRNSLSPCLEYFVNEIRQIGIFVRVSKLAEEFGI